MITTHFKKLLAVVVCLLAGITAQAQFKATYEPYAASDWGNEKPVNFKLTDVATALETDTTTLVAALNSWSAEGSTDASMMFLNTSEGLSDNYTQGSPGGFWVNVDGVPQAWSDDNSALRWFNMLGWDAEEDLFVFTIGQFPGQCAVGNTFTPKFVLKLGEKEVSFEITINIIEKPVVNIPEPELAWAKLTVVETVTKDLKVKPDFGRDENVTVELTEALAKLGITEMDFINDNINKLLFATDIYINDDVAMGNLKADSLTNTTSANGYGFWMAPYLEVSEQGSEVECVRGTWPGAYVYLEGFTFDAETGTLKCATGSMDGKVLGGKTYFTTMYFVWGEKAICIRYNWIVEEVQLSKLTDYEKVGENTVKIEMEPMSSYDTKNFSIDIETINNTLGTVVDDFYMLSNETDLTQKKTEGAGGYWINQSGYAVSWGGGELFYITPKADDFSKFGIGQKPNNMNVGDSVRAIIYFLAEGKYYQQNIDLVIIEPKTVDAEFTVVAQRAIEVQQVPVDYEWTSGEDIPEAWVEEQLGTSDWVLYALDKLNEDGSEKEGNAKYSKSYTCTPYPGFWMDGEGHNVGWNQTPTRVGITVASPEGKFSLMQHPGCSLGDVFRFPIFLVNEDNGKMVQFNFTYSIVESVVEVTEVGKETLVLPVDKDGATTTLDLNKIATALETTVDDLASGTYMHGMTDDGTYGGGVNVTDVLAFTRTGVVTTDEGEVFMFFDQNDLSDDGILTINTYSNDDIAENFSAMGQMCFLVSDKRYVVELKFVSKTVFTGINDIQTAAVKLQPMFDLQGRQVKKAQRGLYIQNGRKVLVK